MLAGKQFQLLFFWGDKRAQIGVVGQQRRAPVQSRDEGPHLGNGQRQPCHVVEPQFSPASRRQDAVDGLRLMLDMLNSFMSVIGIAALVAGGVGVAQAPSSFLESRIDSIAALKALGADAGTIRAALRSCRTVDPDDRRS